MAINNLTTYFPYISYTLDDYNTEQVVTDIFRRVNFTKEFIENSAFFETYDVLQGETPEQVSYRFYGTTRLHWLILMINNIVDPRFEWPQTDPQIFEQTEKRFGGKDQIFTRNYAKNTDGYQVETFFLLTQDSTHKKPVRLSFETTTQDVPTQQPIAYADTPAPVSYVNNYEVLQTENETYRNIKIIKREALQSILDNYKIALQN